MATTTCTTSAAPLRLISTRATVRLIHLHISHPPPLCRPKGVETYDSIFVGVHISAPRLAEFSGGSHIVAAEWARPASQHASVTEVPGKEHRNSERNGDHVSGREGG